RREGFFVFERRCERCAHRRIRDVADHAAVKGPHRVRVALARIERHHGAAELDRLETETEELCDGRRRDIALDGPLHEAKVPVRGGGSYTLFVGFLVFPSSVRSQWRSSLPAARHALITSSESAVPRSARERVSPPYMSATSPSARCLRGIASPSSKC